MRAEEAEERTVLFEILNKEEGHSLGRGHYIKMGYDILYNYIKCHHLIFHNLHI